MSNCNPLGQRPHLSFPFWALYGPEGEAWESWREGVCSQSSCHAGSLCVGARLAGQRWAQR